MTVAHVDMDAFFASVALLDRPHLRERPVVIANSRARSVVAAASYPARRYGVRSAMPLAEAERLCPGLTVLPSDMGRYREISGEVMALLDRYSDQIEVAGLDEAYLDLSSSPAPRARARSLKADVRERTGLTCSVGLGPNKLIAKVASNHDKPDGLCHLTTARYREIIAGAGVRILPGVGPRTEERLRLAGIATAGQLAGADDHWLRDRIGPLASALIDRANGRDDRQIEAVRVRKSESRERTFESDTRNRELLERALDELAIGVIEGLEVEGLRGRTATVKVRFAPFTTRTRSHTAARPFHSAGEASEVGAALLRDLMSTDPAPVRLIGIGVSSLEQASGATELSLF